MRVQHETQALGPQSWAKGALEFHLDETAGLIRIRGSGFWTLEQTQQHFAGLRLLITRMRGEGRRIRVLVDLTKSAIQSIEVAQEIGNATRYFYRPHDKVAMMVDSSLMKLQMRRTIDATNHQYFMSERAAELWLSA